MYILYCSLNEWLPGIQSKFFELTVVIWMMPYAWVGQLYSERIQREVSIHCAQPCESFDVTPKEWKRPQQQKNMQLQKVSDIVEGGWHH